MNWIIKEDSYSIDKASKFNAGSKAKDDSFEIIKSLLYRPLVINVPFIPIKTALFHKVYRHMRICKCWLDCLSAINEGDTIALQYPEINSTVFLSYVLRKIKSKHVKIMAIVHDVESIRSFSTTEMTNYSVFRKRNELKCLYTFDAIISHNEKMTKLLVEEFGIDKSKIYNLEIFDYLTETKRLTPDYDKSVIVAGNLDKTKSGYLYSLPESPDYNLFGMNYAPEKEQANIHYMGAFPPEILPEKLTGSFGLVWDGPSSETCSDVFGNYLKYNNPHKTSLYLASGIPVIIWSQAAMADFVLKENCGIVVDSLYDIDQKLERITKEDYSQMCDNAWKIGEKLREGYYLKHAINQIMKDWDELE